MRLSIVVPLYNEESNVGPLLARVHEVLGAYPHPWELILVDDGSADRTAALIAEGAARYGEHVRLVCLQRNFGQTAAMQAGIDAARGEVIATLDGDMQNDPVDIPMLVDKLLGEDLDLVAGWRKNRQDALVMRKIPSRIANRIIGRLTKVHLHDYGCSLKVYRARVIKSVTLYGEMHRFIPAWMATQTSPQRIAEMPVSHYARTAGESKYGISRTFRVILDLLAVFFFMRYQARPGHFFGFIGLVFGVLGGLVLTLLAWDKFVLGENIGHRPLLLIGIMCVMMSIQFLTTGVLSELLARVYFESTPNRHYTVRNADEVNAATEATRWHAK